MFLPPTVTMVFHASHTISTNIMVFLFKSTIVVCLAPKHLAPRHELVVHPFLDYPVAEQRLNVVVVNLTSSFGCAEASSSKV